jgi:hypothetical protein
MRLSEQSSWKLKSTRIWHHAGRYSHWEFEGVFLDPDYGSSKLLSNISNYTQLYMAPCSWRLYNGDLSKIILKLIWHFNSFSCNRIILQEVKFIYWYQIKKKKSFICCNNTYFDVILCPFWTDTLIFFFES